jgi:tetratricopeptide (TPR) repeat protein
VAERKDASALLLFVVSAIALQFARKRPFLAVGWLWYLGTLVPVIGLVQVGLQAKADRYTYFPSIGIFLMLAWGLPSLNAIRRSRAFALGAAVLVALVALGWRTRVELGYWTDSVTLFDRALAVTPANYLAHLEKGYALAVERHWLDDAIAEYRDALRINPGFHVTWSRLADALLEKGEIAEAVEWYRSILEAVPERIHERQNLAVALVRLGRPAEAIPYFEAVVQRQPRLREGQVGLGLALEQTGRVAEAIATYQSAIAQRPADAELHGC